MGFSLQIQADYGSEMLQNIHPEGKPSSGKAVLSFLTALWLFCDTQAKANVKYHPNDELFKRDIEWFKGFELKSGSSLCSKCHALLNCMWGDGGDPTEYLEDEYDFYKKRSENVGTRMTEEQFREMVWSYRSSWQPINEVMSGVEFLLNAFKTLNLETYSFYEPEYSIPDFEALYANLVLLSKRENEVVRLNFH